MASKVLVPTAPFAKLQINKASPDSGGGGGFLIGASDPAGRVVHLEHSVRFLQEQHRLMLSGLHAEIEALRERNRDLQFQLIFNKESSSKTASPTDEDSPENNEEAQVRRDVPRLEREIAAARGETATARGEARMAEARAMHLERMLEVQAEKISELEESKCHWCGAACGSVPEAGAEAAGVAGGVGGTETRAELRQRLAEAERLVRRLRADAERQRREVLPPAAGVTNLLFDDAAARRAHVACMKNSLQAQLRAGALDLGFHNNYQFPPLPTHDFYRPIEGGGGAGGGGGGRARRPLTLPDLAHAHASTVYANNYTRQRGHYEGKKKSQSNAENINPRSPEDPNVRHIEMLPSPTDLPMSSDNIAKYPELKIVVTKLLPQLLHTNANGRNSACGGRARARRQRHPRAPPDH